MALLINGKEISKKVRLEVKTKVAEFSPQIGRAPSLAVILVGGDPASEVYVRNKHRACKRAGIKSVKIELPENTTEEQLLNEIKTLNEDETIDGFLVQVPLPSHIDTWKALLSVNPDKDVDGFHPVNVGKLSIGLPAPKSCTPAGIMRLLSEYEIPIEGKDAVIIGRSNIVGKPLSMMMMAKNATVTVCHSRTQNLAEIAQRADILVAAIGRAGIITKDFVKPGATVIDVGVNLLEDGGFAGDVSFDEVEPLASAITPVPGGVGPMTIAMLLQNTLDAYLQKNETHH